jgi:arylformamidase
MSSPAQPGLSVIDLSHTISAVMPFYPGTEPPVFSRPCTLESHGFVEQKITLYSHTGTHMDAPAHILAGAPTLEELGMGSFVGSAVVLDFKGLRTSVIGLDDLKPFGGAIEGKDFVLLYTGWSDLWGTDAYYEGFPCLSREAALWLADFGLKGIGMDMISIDPAHTTTYPNHRIFMERNTVIIENLTNLDHVVGVNFLFCCLPLKLHEADGAPVRAVALLGI